MIYVSAEVFWHIADICVELAAFIVKPMRKLTHQ